MKRGTRRVLVLTGLLIAVALLLAARWFRGHNQVADNTFDFSVARPTYVDRHPRVLIDEAHRDFHTARGRYAPFAKLPENDGYHVAPLGGQFTREALKVADVLVIANAMGSWMLMLPAAADPAFTNPEADVVRDWGRSQALALRFGAGRVVVVREAAMLTAQVTSNGSRKMGMNWPGNDNHQFVLNLMHRLSGELN